MRKMISGSDLRLEGVAHRNIPEFGIMAGDRVSFFPDGSGRRRVMLARLVDQLTPEHLEESGGISWTKKHLSIVP